MSYQIQYGPKEVTVKKRKNNPKHIYVMLGVILIVLITAAKLQDWRSPIGAAFLPGDPAVTKSAFNQLADSLKSGSSLSQAIYVFCTTVIQGANIA